MTFAESGAEALRHLGGEAYDVLITDLGMPGMSGAELLRRVQEEHPKIVRFVLAAPSEQPLVMECAAFTHQFLTRPCEPDVLRHAVERACDMESSIRRERVGRLVGRMDHLPSLPDIYVELVERMRDPECSLDEVAALVSRDISLTARVLKLVNSAFFGLRHQVSSLNEAVNYLGMDTVKALVLSINAFAQFEDTELGGLSLESLWTHSLVTAGCAKVIAEFEGGSARQVDQAFVAGMLHDTGKLVLAANLTADYGEAMAGCDGSPRAILAAEEAAFGATHADVGGHLFGLWGLPDGIVEAVTWHHDPSGSDHDLGVPLAYVHAADVWVHRPEQGPDAADLDRAFFERIGLLESLPEWHRVCAEAYLGGVGA